MGSLVPVQESNENTISGLYYGEQHYNEVYGKLTRGLIFMTHTVHIAGGGHFEQIQYGWHWRIISIGNWNHKIPWPPKHIFRCQNQVNSCARSRNIHNYEFLMAAILKSNMADSEVEFQVVQYLQLFAIVLCKCTSVPIWVCYCCPTNSKLCFS